MRNLQNHTLLRAHADVRIFHVEMPGTSVLPIADDGEGHSVHTLPHFPRGYLRWVQGVLSSQSLPDVFFRPAIADALRLVLAEFAPDAILLEEPWLSGYLPVLRAYGAPIIVDLHNIESVLYSEMCHQVMGYADKCRTMMLRRLAHRAERLCIASASRLWVCSDHDAARCREAYPGSPEISIVPNGIDAGRYGDAPGSPRVPCSLVFCGNFSYFPNAQAAAFAIDHIFPRIRAAIPSATLCFVGRNPTRSMLRAARDGTGIRVTGLVPDVRPFLRSASAALVPMIIGGGTRLKVLEAMAIGCPVISTTRGAEGLDVTHDREVLIADDADALASAAVRLFGDDLLRDRLSFAAAHCIRDRYSWENISCSVTSALPVNAPSPSHA